ncbi:hypothetical protein C8R44DRAFT_894055 [Mycena epipterygia]|nr:hypothetical protein C8R44DRAFT_894055 [Mycena epipterygia]
MAVTAGTKETYIGVFLENIIYGLYLSAFVECCVLFWKRQQRRNMTHVYLISTTVLMFILITIRCIIDTFRCIAPFGKAIPDYGPLNDTVGLVTNGCWFFVTSVADAFIVFRTFIVWNRNWAVIVIPLILLLANFGSSIWLLICLRKLQTVDPAFWGNISFKSLNTFLALTLCTNLICTGLISFRILRSHRRVMSLVSSDDRTDSIKIVSIIVESAAIYTLLLLGTLISNSLDSFVNFVLFNCTPPTIGLVFSYIIIRVGRGTSYGEATGAAPTMSLAWARENNQTFELSGHCDDPCLSVCSGGVELGLQGDGIHNEQSKRDIETCDAAAV